MHDGSRIKSAMSTGKMIRLDFFDELKKHTNIPMTKVYSAFTAVGPVPNLPPTQMGIAGTFEVSPNFCDFEGCLSPGIIGVIGDIVTATAIVQANAKRRRAVSVSFHSNISKSIKSGEKVKVYVTANRTDEFARTGEGRLDFLSDDGQILASFSQQMLFQMTDAWTIEQGIPE